MTAIFLRICNELNQLPFNFHRAFWSQDLSCNCAPQLSAPISKPPTCNNDRWIIFLSDMMWFNLHIGNSLETNYNNRSLKKKSMVFVLICNFLFISAQFMRRVINSCAWASWIISQYLTDRLRTFSAIGFRLKFSVGKSWKASKWKWNLLIRANFWTLILSQLLSFSV